MGLDELPRLDELRRYELVEAGPDGSLDRLAELAARVCHAPIGYISFVDETHQRFLARWGVPGEVGDEVPKGESICAHALERPEPIFTIEALASDPRFGQLPLVQGLGLGFYAGAQLVTPGGFVLGTVCVIDRRARTLDADETRGLLLVRDQVMELLEGRRELGELRRSEGLRQEAVEALLATQRDLQARIDLRTREIEAAHTKTRQILERIGDAYTVLDGAARFVYVNRRAAEILGRTADELLGKEIWSTFPGGGGALRDPYDRAVREQRPVTVQMRYAPWDRWFEGRIYPSPDGAAMVFTEITDRKRAEDEVERSRRRLVEAQRVAHIGSWEWDLSRDEVVWSDELYRIYGVPLGAPLGGYQGFLARVHPDDLQSTQKTIGAAIESGTPFVYDHRIVRADGAVRMLHTRGEAIKVDGKLERLVGACWDVTELDQATRANRRTVALLEATLQVTSDGLVVVDAAGEVTAHNAALAALFHFPADTPPKQALARVAEALVDPAQLTARARSLGPADESTDVLQLRDGRRIEARSRPHVVDGEVAGRVWSFRAAPPAA